jgi:hypothetical protein
LIKGKFILLFFLFQKSIFANKLHHEDQYRDSQVGTSQQHDYCRRSSKALKRRNLTTRSHACSHKVQEVLPHHHVHVWTARQHYKSEATQRIGREYSQTRASSPFKMDKVLDDYSPAEQDTICFNAILHESQEDQQHQLQ